MNEWKEGSEHENDLSEDKDSYARLSNGSVEIVAGGFGVLGVHDKTEKCIEWCREENIVNCRKYIFLER